VVAVPAADYGRDNDMASKDAANEHDESRRKGHGTKPNVGTSFKDGRGRHMGFFDALPFDADRTSSLLATLSTRHESVSQPFEGAIHGAVTSRRRVTGRRQNRAESPSRAASRYPPSATKLDTKLSTRAAHLFWRVHCRDDRHSATEGWQAHQTVVDRLGLMQRLSVVPRQAAS
jgi:hypothetical protein